MTRAPAPRRFLRTLAWFVALLGLALALFGAQAPVGRADCTDGDGPLRPCLDSADHDAGPARDITPAGQ